MSDDDVRWWVVEKDGEVLCYDKHEVHPRPYLAPKGDPFVLRFDTPEQALSNATAGGSVRCYSAEEVLSWGEKADEVVDHPSHYGGENNPYEAIKVIETLELGFHLGNVVKYVLRAGKKPGADELEDLKKARWYLDRRIQQIS